MAGPTEFHGIKNASASAAFAITLGGKYMVTAIATWGGGNLHLQVMGNDGTTLLDVGSSTNFTANGVAIADLAPGSYQFTITTATAVYASITRVPEQ